MDLGENLYNLRKKKNLSQEEVAEKLNVTRQTISKWETGESKPDFDKIIPICELFEITSDELLTGVEKEATIQENRELQNKDLAKIKCKRAIMISAGVFLYFLSVVAIILFEELNLNQVFGVGVFLIICGIATSLMVYQGIVYSKVEEQKIKVETQEERRFKVIKDLASTIFLVIYLLVSFTTMAWHITWIIWIIYAVVEDILKLLFELGDKKNGK